VIKVFLNDDLLGKHFALQILKQLKIKKKWVLGCPGGRSLKKTYFYIGRLSTKLNISLNNLTIVMMDEYVEKKRGKYSLVNPKSHYSCVRFSKQVIKRFFNYKKNKRNELKKENILFPPIDFPNTYDKKIIKIGGIDIFLLASGSSDGHVV
jgi:glucosamine-6-phosphate deaminase